MVMPEANDLSLRKKNRLTKEGSREEERGQPRSLLMRVILSSI
jgi:hypothetical protein